MNEQSVQRKDGVMQTVAASEGQHVRFGKALGTRRMLSTDAFGLVEHDLPAGQLGSPMHAHENEDEYSYVLSGRLTAQIGDDVVEAGPGDLVVKPRGIQHAFWNSGDEPVRFLELISPAGFENYFFARAEPFSPGDAAAMGAVVGRYRLALRMETVPELVERNGLLPPF